MGKQIYHVKLTEDDQKIIRKYLRSSKYSQESKTRARILLAMDENQLQKPESKRIIAERLDVCAVSVAKVCKRYATHGVLSALNRKQREEPAIPSIVTGYVEAHIIAVCCSKPPEGKSRWSAKMIANKIVLDGIVDTISDDTVGRVLKKRNLSHT